MFNPPSPIVSDSNGYVSTSYTFSKIAGAYTLTASSAAAASLPIAETATPGPATKMVIHGGNKQSGQAGSILPTQPSVAILDAYKNDVPGITVTYLDKSGEGTLNPSVTVTNSSGFAPVSYQLPNADGTYKISTTASESQCPTCKAETFMETATGDAPGNLGVVSGNNQSAPVNTALPQPLVVQVTDQRWESDRRSLGHVLGAVGHFKQRLSEHQRERTSLGQLHNGGFSWHGYH